MSEITIKLEANIKIQTTGDWQEAARLYAESKMPENWDRKDVIEIGTFYKWFIKYINDNFTLIHSDKPLQYKMETL